MYELVPKDVALRPTRHLVPGTWYQVPGTGLRECVVLYIAYKRPLLMLSKAHILRATPPVC